MTIVDLIIFGAILYFGYRFISNKITNKNDGPDYKIGDSRHLTDTQKNWREMRINQQHSEYAEKVAYLEKHVRPFTVGEWILSTVHPMMLGRWLFSMVLVIVIFLGIPVFLEVTVFPLLMLAMLISADISVYKLTLIKIVTELDSEYYRRFGKKDK